MNDSEELTYRVTVGLVRYERRKVFWRRLKQLLLASVILAVVGGLGYAGYRYLSQAAWWRDLPLQRWKEHYFPPRAPEPLEE